jgi:YHS domain-containing protein
MKHRTITFLWLIVVLSTAVFTLTAGGQDKTAEKQVIGCCPGCPMSGSAKAGKTDAATGPQARMQCCCMSMMHKAGVKPEMMRRCQAMMQTPIFLDSPCSVYGQADVLKLSEEQKKKLIEIEKEARDKAIEVLTDEQKKQMGEIPDKPMTMAQMCQQMCSKMMSGEGKTGQMIMCPCMQMFSGSNDVQTETKQVTCPVMGGQINLDVYVEHKGKKVYFCCPACKGKFESDPEKYVDKLPQYKQ